jgi:hypothetical protein
MKKKNHCKGKKCPKKDKCEMYGIDLKTGECCGYHFGQCSFTQTKTK